MSASIDLSVFAFNLQMAIAHAPLTQTTLQRNWIRYNLTKSKLSLSAANGLSSWFILHYKEKERLGIPGQETRRKFQRHMSPSKIADAACLRSLQFNFEATLDITMWHICCRVLACGECSLHSCKLLPRCVSMAIAFMNNRWGSPSLEICSCRHANSPGFHQRPNKNTIIQMLWWLYFLALRTWHWRFFEHGTSSSATCFTAIQSKLLWCNLLDLV